MLIHVRGSIGESLARHRVRRRHAALVMAALLAAILTMGLGGGGVFESDRSARVVRVEATGSDPAASRASATPSSQAAAAAPTAQPSPSSPPPDISAAAEYLSRIPAFPPPPPPQPMALPADPQARWLSRIPTQQPVAFITIDDGWTKLPVVPALLWASKVPVTLFLSGNAIADNPTFFSNLPANVRIESHSLYHNNLRGHPYQAQLGDICGSANQLASMYGRRPVLFRPPYGEKDGTTLQAVYDCGLKAALFWSETVDKGVVRYQVGDRIQPGDIILMHFRPAFAEDFLAALNAIHSAGLTPALLEDYIV